MHGKAVRSICASMHKRLCSVRGVAELIDQQVSKSSIHRWLSNDGFRPRAVSRTDDSFVEFVRAKLVADPCLTARQIAFAARDAFETNISVSSIRTCIMKAGFTYKKCRYVVDKVGLDEVRATFARLTLASVHPSEVISIDESYVTHDSSPLCGYAMRGIRLNVKVKSMRSKRWSFLLAVSNTEVVSSVVLDGTVDSSVFATFVRQLKGSGKKYLLMDNASFHKTSGVLSACDFAGLTPLFLPPYTPFFQPVEHCFSVVHARMRASRPPMANDRPSLQGVAVRVQQSLEQGLVEQTLGNMFTKCWTRMGELASSFPAAAV